MKNNKLKLTKILQKCFKNIKISELLNIIKMFINNNKGYNKENKDNLDKEDNIDNLDNLDSLDKIESLDN